MASFPPASSHVKGAALREFLAWYAAHRERAPLDVAIASLPSSHRAGLQPGAEAFGVVPSTWYPSPTIHVLLDAIAHALSPAGRPRLVHEATTHVVDRMMSGVYAVLFRMVATPDRYAHHIQRAWRQLHDTGERSVALLSPTEAESRTWGWTGHHPLLCEVASETMALVFERMGCRSVVARRTRCVSQGDPDCRLLLRWTLAAHGPRGPRCYAVAAMQELSQIDLVFCLDLTASMQPFIDAARRQVVTILAGLRSGASADLRVALVGYRDHESADPQGPDPTVVQAFTPSDDGVHQALRQLSVGSSPSNTDAAEAVFAGLGACVQRLPWRPRAFKVLVLIGDAPPHGCGADAQPHPDRFPHADPSGWTLESLAGALEHAGIFLHALGMVPSNFPAHDAVLEKTFHRLATATGGSYRSAASADAAMAVVEAIGQRIFGQMTVDRMVFEKLMASADLAPQGASHMDRARSAMASASRPAGPASLAEAPSPAAAPSPSPASPQLSEDELASSLQRLKKRGLLPDE